MTHPSPRPILTVHLAAVLRNRTSTLHNVHTTLHQLNQLTIAPSKIRITTHDQCGLLITIIPNTLRPWGLFERRVNAVTQPRTCRYNAMGGRYVRFDKDVYIFPYHPYTYTAKMCNHANITTCIFKVCYHYKTVSIIRYLLCLIPQTPNTILESDVRTCSDSLGLIICYCYIYIYMYPINTTYNCNTSKSKRVEQH